MHCIALAVRKSRERLDYRRSSFVENHNILIMGAPAQGKYPEAGQGPVRALRRRSEASEEEIRELGR